MQARLDEPGAEGRGLECVLPFPPRSVRTTGSDAVLSLLLGNNDVGYREASGVLLTHILTEAIELTEASELWPIKVGDVVATIWSHEGLLQDRCGKMEKVHGCTTQGFPGRPGAGIGKLHTRTGSSNSPDTLLPSKHLEQRFLRQASNLKRGTTRLGWKLHTPPYRVIEHGDRGRKRERTREVEHRPLEGGDAQPKPLRDLVLAEPIVVPADATLRLRGWASEGSKMNEPQLRADYREPPQQRG